MSKVIIGIGLPGAGKTTVLKPFAEKNSYTYICPDDIRAELLGDAGDQSKNREVWQEAYKRTADALANEETVVLDATFANSVERKDFIRFVRDHGAKEVHGVFADVPLDIANERNRTRRRVVSYGGMEEMNEMLKSAPPVLADGFDRVLSINQLQELERAEIEIV